MKRLLLVVAAVAISSSAFADSNGPTRQGNRCWAPADQRGYGFWDFCADPHELARRGRRNGLTSRYDEAVTITDTSSAFGGGGGGSAGGGNK